MLSEKLVKLQTLLFLCEIHKNIEFQAWFSSLIKLFIIRTNAVSGDRRKPN